MLRYFNSLFGVKSLNINNGIKHTNTSRYFNPFIEKVRYNNPLKVKSFAGYYPQDFDILTLVRSEIGYDL